MTKFDGSSDPNAKPSPNQVSLSPELSGERSPFEDQGGTKKLVFQGR